MTLPIIDSIELKAPIHIEKSQDLREFSNIIADRINNNQVLGILLLVDPARVLEEIGFELSEEVKTVVSNSVLGITHEQMNQYDRIKEMAKRESRVSGIRSVKVKPMSNCSSSVSELRASGIKPPINENPIGNYDTTIDIAESVVEKIVQVTYDEGVYQHRFPLPLASHGSEFVIGRPKIVSFDTPADNNIKIEIPFALIQNISPKEGTINMEASIITEEEDGKPAYLRINFAQVSSVKVESEKLTQVERDILEKAIKLLLPSQKIPLSPLIKEFSAVGLTLDDMDFKTHNSPGQLLDSLLISLNFSPNNNMGNIQNVTQFVKEDWALGFDGRILSQKFNDWWGSPAATKYHRFNTDKLEVYKDLIKQGKIGDIFDPNGDIVVNGVEFSCQPGSIDFKADVTAENKVLWIDINADVTGKLKLTVDSATHELKISVTDIDSSISCWSKFLIGLFCAFLGFVFGGVIGGIIGGVVGGVVGVTIGVTVGAGVSSFVAAIINGIILPAIAEAAMNDKLEELQDVALLIMKYDWQIPGTNLMLKATGEWIEIKEGEVLLGGKLDIPPLANPAISISQDLKSSHKEVDLPWAYQKKSKSGNYFLDSQIKVSVKAEKLMEKPLTYSWSMEGEPIAGDGEEALIYVIPSIDYSFKPAN